MNAPLILALSDAVKSWLVPGVAGCVPLLIFLLTRHAVRSDTVRATATQVEQLYVGNAKELFVTLQDELRTRNARIGALEAEREQLRSALLEERQCFEQVKQRHRDLVAFMVSSGVKVPDELHV